MADYISVIETADLDDLRTIPNDRFSKQDKFGKVRIAKVSIKGMILDSFDEGKLSGVQAMRLLVMCHQRLNQNVVGFSKVTDAGELEPIW